MHRRRVRVQPRAVRHRDVADPVTLDTMDDFYRQAYTLLTSSVAQNAFSLEGETKRGSSPRVDGPGVKPSTGPWSKS